MTREEAIELLESMKGDLYDLYDDNDLTALDLAISALSENKGEWVKMGEAYVCSRCSTTCACTEMADKWIWHTDDKFCRGCGADMRKPKEVKAESEG